MAALTKDDLVELWKSSVDPEFARALLETPESGVEVIEASAEVFAFTSDAVEQTSQAFFLRHHSAETYPPASGAVLAQVELTVMRGAPASRALVLGAQTFLVEEQSPDAGEDGPVLVPTGRRYLPSATLVFLPGELTLAATFFAERPGAGYNLPAPGSISLTVDSGTVSGEGASLVPGVTSHQLVLAPGGETVAPSAVGQYLALTSGANAGQLRRVIGFLEPDAAAGNNGIVLLAPTEVLSVSGVTGTFSPGERVEQVATGAAGALLELAGAYAVLDRLAAPAFAAGSIRGVQSGATATVGAVIDPPNMAAESLTAAWQLLSWADLGVLVTNPESPTGGASPVLDHLGDEKTMNRSPGESDEPYRGRLERRPDVVTPNALTRAMNRVLAPYGLTGCLREPSDLDTFEGFFYDSPATEPEGRRYAYDLDFTVNPADRYKVYLDLAEYRSFFVAAIPPLTLGEFGLAYDEGFECFYDAAPYNAFYDGFPAGAAELRIAVWNALDGAREAGVGFDLVEDRYGCW